MRIGFVGLGKLGLPVALAIESKGHEVMGCDASDDVRQNIERRHIPYMEDGAQGLLATSRLRVGTIAEVVDACDIVFVAVQTPHAPEFEGCTPLPAHRADFDYSRLLEAVGDVAEAAEAKRRSVVLVVVSTVLPGTMRREVMPLLNRYVELVYNPFFIAMGTAIADFLAPEFVLLGAESAPAAEVVEAFYATIHDRPVVRMGIEEAELTKVAYNTFITSKIVFANTLMEICERMGADVDAVTRALALGTDRIISPKYLRGGMGDGGGCHPRDNIALSWLARKLNLSYDLFGALMQAREDQAIWLAQLIDEEAGRCGLPVVMLGKAFKAGTNITVGSPARLLSCYLPAVRSYDPLIDDPWTPAEPSLFFVATNHAQFTTFAYPAGSVVLDPWDYIPDRRGVTVRRIGRKQGAGRQGGLAG